MHFQALAQDDGPGRWISARRALEKLNHADGVKAQPDALTACYFNL